MTTKITKLEDILQKHSQKSTEVEDSKASKKGDNKTQSIIPRGKPKSGRAWKTTKTKFSSIIKTRGIRNSFEKKQALREELKQIKQASKNVIAAKKEEKEAKKQRRRENLLRQEENRKKAEVVQVIKNSSKIKRMKKKQLRYIEKRDTTKLAK